MAEGVAKILGFKDCKSALDENVKVKNIKVYSDENVNLGTFINELGVYQLITKSPNRAIACKFQEWVFEQVFQPIDNLRAQPTITLKQMDRYEILYNKEYVYIATTLLYMEQNYFKVGGTINKGKARLYGYNTGRPDEDNYFYVYMAECNNYRAVEHQISILLAQHKPNDNKEMYNIHYDDLVEIVSLVVDGLNSNVDYINDIRSRIYKNLVTKPPVIKDSIHQAQYDDSDDLSAEMFIECIVNKIKSGEENDYHVRALRNVMDMSIRGSTLFRIFCSWCRAKGLHHGSAVRFGMLMTAHVGINQKLEISGSNWYIIPGIRSDPTTTSHNFKSPYF